MENIIFDDYFKDIRSWNEPIVHVVIVEEDGFIKLYENDILKLEKIKEKI